MHEVMQGRNNNLNLIRFVAALSVIWSHSYSLTSGPNGDVSLLDRMTSGRLSIGGLAVGVFFLYGGMLIAKSCESHLKPMGFFAARIRRIFPQLVFTVLLSTFVFGPLLSSNDAATYFHDSRTYRYLLNALLVPVHGLPGVFEANPYPAVVNGALWTLPVEFACYVLCYVTFRLTSFKRGRATALICTLIVAGLAFLHASGLMALSVVRAVLEFLIGMLFWTWRDRVIVSRTLGIAAIGSTCILCALGLDLPAMLLTVPYALVWLGWGTKRKFQNFAYGADLSYGTYLWGFPVQQALVALWPLPMRWPLNTVLAAGIAVLMGLANHLLMDRWLAKLARRIIRRR
ncbi:acyltransferase family protein [Olsenella urininfantis]|uniref:acyltransferase family protein n=1 Tax=Olsenella urininfantis TaxID=1871033 RepID=UPI001F1583D6|nr:acyltransferase [Olsenella urininfantis]